VLVLTLVIAWLALRRPPGSVEWVALWTLVIVSWTAGQVASGPLYNGAWAVNGVAALTILSIAFDLPMIAFVAVTGWVAYTGVQLHFHPAGKALTVAAMLASIEALVVLVVYGTATFLRDSLRDVGILHARMAETADRERARIASELHDDTLQALAAAALRLDRLATGPAPQDVAAVTREVREMITGAADRARRLSFDLYPPELVHRGLAPALSALGGQIASESTFQVDVEATRARYPAEAERLVYRTIRELLINAQKHSDATRVVVTVAASDGRVRGRVEDDGRGFGEEELMSARRQLHVGLDAANERIKLAGGEFDIRPAHPHGTQASFWIPTAIVPPSSTSDG